MEKLMSYYQSKINKLSSSLERVERALKASDNDHRISVVDLLEKKVNDSQERHLYIQFIEDIESTGITKACTELNEGDGFAHIQDVVTMISKAGNLLDMNAVNQGRESNVSKAMQNIANNISNSI